MNPFSRVGLGRLALAIAAWGSCYSSVAESPSKATEAAEKFPMDVVSVDGLWTESAADPSGLLFAVFMSPDGTLLKKSASAFPDFPPFQWLLACRSSGKGERQAAVAALRKADSTNALGAYLSVAEKIESAQFEIALQELVEADGCRKFSCYEEALIGALRTALEKHWVSSRGGVVQFEAIFESIARLQKLDDLGLRLIPQLAAHFREGGDEQAAFVARDMATNLGRRMQASSIAVLSRMGLEVEKETFSSFGVDPESGAQSQRHRKKLESALAELSAVEAVHRTWSQRATASDWAAFGSLLLERGQVEALRATHARSTEADHSAR